MSDEAFSRSQAAQSGIAISNSIEISSLEGIKQGVIHGLGIAAVSGLAVKQESDSGLLAKIPMEDVTFERGIRYIYHKNKHLSPGLDSSSPCWLGPRIRS
ncbi:LysR substrate-binding domain-containing protein [Paenibacillus thiaminolyticus]|uniref:LysR substrate-binding domain-containing protein n=1 Tax=Paenibacillus thiaminolyticus TaxID=49283 RepID=UPI002175B147|nr:LysR substrate-binding domain-containing protein [Paenibacillus thiaminolyticus]